MDWKKLGRNISVLHRHSQMTMARLLEPLGIGMGQYPYILEVCGSPGIRQDELTAGLMFNKSSVARALTHLEDSGFLRRETDPADKRSYRLFPTEKGLAAQAVIYSRLEEVNESLTAGFSEQERQTVADLLQRMAQNVSACGHLHRRRESAPTRYSTEKGWKYG